MIQQSGVFQLEGGGWTWADADSGERGGEFTSRGAARDAYAAFRKSRAIPSPVPPHAEAPDVAGVKKAAREKPAKVKVAKPAKVKAAKPAKVKGKRAAKGTGVVAKAWAIFDKMDGSRRKDVLVVCAKADLNLNMCKTQYQRWLHRGDK